MRRAHVTGDAGLPAFQELDVSFNEDQSRIRKGHGAENVSRLWRMALNLVKQETTKRRDIKTKRLRAGRDEQSLCQVLRV